MPVRVNADSFFVQIARHADVLVQKGDLHACCMGCMPSWISSFTLTGRVASQPELSTWAAEQWSLYTALCPVIRHVIQGGC